jgi:hypothetical protein
MRVVCSFSLADEPAGAASINGGLKTVLIAKTKGGSFGILIALLPVSFEKQSRQNSCGASRRRELLERDPDYFSQAPSKPPFRRLHY